MRRFSKKQPAVTSHNDELLLQLAEDAKELALLVIKFRKAKRAHENLRRRIIQTIRAVAAKMETLADSYET